MSFFGSIFVWHCKPNKEKEYAGMDLEKSNNDKNYDNSANAFGYNQIIRVIKDSGVIRIMITMTTIMRL
jgi:hypothetical protein